MVQAASERVVISSLNFGRADCAVASRSALPVNYRFHAMYALFPYAFAQHSVHVWTSVSGALTAQSDASAECRAERSSGRIRRQSSDVVPGDRPQFYNWASLL